MVLWGQPKTQNPYENKVLKNDSWIAFKNSYTLKNLFPKLVAIGQLKQIWSLFDNSQMVTKNANKSICGDQKPFNCHNVFFLPRSPFFFPSSLSPLMAIETLSISI
jgi:hypothetical protein